MKWIFSLATFGMLFWMPSLRAQESLSLSDAIQKGLANNFQIQIADRNTAIAKSNNTWKETSRYPTVDLNFNSQNGYTARTDPSIVFQPEISFFSLNAVGSVDLNWTLFDGHQARITKEQLEQLELLGESNAALVVEDVIQAVILAYYQVKVQEEQLNVLEEVLELSADRIAYQKVRQEFGQAGAFELVQTQDAYLNDSTNYLVQLNNYDASIRSLNLAMGVDELDTKYQLTDELAYEAPDYELADLQQKMLSNNNALQRLFIDRELARVNSNLAEAANKPTLNLGTGLSYTISPRDNGSAINFITMEELGFTVGRTFNYYLGLGATYRIYDAGSRRRGIDNAKLQELNAQLSIEDQKRMLNHQLQNTFAQYNNEKQLVAITESLVDNARQNLEISEERFRAGLINSFDYRSVQVAYINASQSRLAAIFNLKTTETELIRLIGGLVR